MRESSENRENSRKYGSRMKTEDNMEQEVKIQKIQQVQQFLKEKGIGAQFVAAVPNFAYLLGVRPLALERLTLLSIPQTGKPRLIVPKLSAMEFEPFASFLEVHSWADGEDPLALVQEEANRLPQNQPIALDHGVSARVVLALNRQLPQLGLYVSEEAISALRSLKDAEETRLMLEIGAIADLALKEAIGVCRVGNTEMDIAATLITTLLHYGAEADPAMPIVASGPNGAEPHHSTGNRRLVRGDSVVIDFGARRNNYYSDMTRTVHIGSPDPEFLTVYEVVRAAQAKALAMVRPGVQLGKLDAAARDHITQAGYGPYFTHRLGHGLGVDVHEEPYLYSSNNEPVRVGMCFSIEPGIYLPGRFGVRIEDCVVVQENGPLVLTHFSKDLIVQE
jgi:Xaa-Pro dipeptidase